jgi:hypothetical protein
MKVGREQWQVTLGVTASLLEVTETTEIDPIHAHRSVSWLARASFPRKEVCAGCRLNGRACCLRLAIVLLIPLWVDIDSGLVSC